MGSAQWQERVAALDSVRHSSQKARAEAWLPACEVLLRAFGCVHAARAALRHRVTTALTLHSPVIPLTTHLCRDKTMPVVVEAASLLGVLLAASAMPLESARADALQRLLPAIYTQSIASNARLHAKSLQVRRLRLRCLSSHSI